MREEKRRNPSRIGSTRKERARIRKGGETYQSDESVCVTRLGDSRDMKGKTIPLYSKGNCEWKREEEECWPKEEMDYSSKRGDSRNEHPSSPLLSSKNIKTFPIREKKRRKSENLRNPPGEMPIGDG